MRPGHLLADAPGTVDDYRSMGGGEALAAADRIGPDAVIGLVRDAGLRGRGGAGFPTGIKWAGVAGEEGPSFVVCNAAEGEPGTFKDRWLMRTNPYQLVEGLAIAARAIGAEAAILATKEKFGTEVARLMTAMEEMAEADMVGGIPITLVTGPDAYLFGEEKALLEVVAGRDPLPTLYPPYVRGLSAGLESSNPTVVNNVETLSNIPHIVRNGVDWFRSLGTDDSPGTMVFTLSGDVRTEAVVELPMGTPLGTLLYGFGEGLAAGRHIRAILSGVSNAPLGEWATELPMDFGSLAAAGSGLGSGGFIVYDDTACITRVAAAASRFLARESCGQCPPCKLGTEVLADRFSALSEGTADTRMLEEASAWIERVTDANRCGLGAGQRSLAAGVLNGYWDEIVAHLDGGCEHAREAVVPMLVDYHPDAGRFDKVPA